MSINIEELKRLHGDSDKDTYYGEWIFDEKEQSILKWIGNHCVYSVANTLIAKEAALICYLRNNCEEIIEALEFVKNRDQTKAQ